MSSERGEEVMRLYLTQVLAERNFDLIPSLAGEAMIDHTQPTLRGPAALDAHARGFCANIPDLSIEVQQIFATDTMVVGIWRWQGTPTQSMAVSATGNAVYPRVIASIFRIEEGMLAEYQAFVDAVDLRTQLVAPAAH